MKKNTKLTGQVYEFLIQKSQRFSAKKIWLLVNIIATGYKFELEVEVG
jgi:hypothetical protein